MKVWVPEAGLLSAPEVPTSEPRVPPLTVQIWNEALPENKPVMIETLETDHAEPAPVVTLTASPEVEEFTKKEPLLTPGMALKLLRTTAPSANGATAKAARVAANEREVRDGGVVGS